MVGVYKVQINNLQIRGLACIEWSTRCRFLVWYSWDGSYFGSSRGKQGIGSSQK